MVRAEDAQRVEVLEEERGVLLGDLPGVEALLARGRLELVVGRVGVVVARVADVGDVHHLRDGVAARLEPAFTLTH